MLRRLLLRLYRLPDRQVLHDPAELGLDAQDVEVAAIDGARLRGWYLAADPVGQDHDVPSPASPPRPAVVVMHGWASAAGDLLPTAPAILAAGLPMLYLDARGHGRSDTAEFMSMPRFAEDVEAAVGWLRRRPEIDPERIALVGHSVGAGACLLAASRDPRIAAVVSISSMAHPREMIARSFRRHRAPAILIRAALRTIERTIGHRFDDFAPLHTIARVAAPVLVVHGLDDPTVPTGDATRLAEAGGPTATLELVPGADHGDLHAFEPVIPQVLLHLQASLTSPASGGRDAPQQQATGGGADADG